MNDSEVWRDVKGFEGLYKVSNMGRVKNNKEHILKPYSSEKGYRCVDLNKNGNHKKHRVHRLVAQAFIPNPNNYPCVNHIDEIKNHNYVQNLEWCTVAYNNSYGNRLKKISDKNKKSHIGLKQSKETIEKRESKIRKPVIQINSDNNIVKIWKCARQASSKGFNPSSIASCCKGKINSHHGYKWKYFNPHHID